MTHPNAESALRNSSPSTTAMSALAGVRNVTVVAVAVVVGGATSMPSTSSNSYSVARHDLRSVNTGANARVQPPNSNDREASRTALTELHRRSGLTWDQLAAVFGVSRRSVHFWASGKPMTADHEAHLHRALALLQARTLDAGATRAALLSVIDGEQVLAMLTDRRYDDVKAALEALPSGRAITRTPLSARAQAERRPLEPDLLAASEDRAPQPAEGRGRAVRTSRSKGRGES